MLDFVIRKIIPLDTYLYRNRINPLIAHNNYGALPILYIWEWEIVHGFNHPNHIPHIKLFIHVGIPSPFFVIFADVLDLVVRKSVPLTIYIYHERIGTTITHSNYGAHLSLYLWYIFRRYSHPNFIP